MSEWLTTGQLIDKLKIGEVAVPDNKLYLPVKRVAEGIIWVNPKTYEQSEVHQDFFRVTGSTMSIRWKIIPRYVDFYTAMRAYEKGKDIVYHHSEDKTYTFTNGLHSIFYRLFEDSISLHELIRGKWTIIEQGCERI